MSAIPKLVGTFTGLRLCATPELSYTANGIALLKFKCIADKYISGKGADKVTEKVSYRFTVWREKAEFIHGLLMQFAGEKGPGVGCEVTVYIVEQLPSVWAWVMKDDQGKVMLDKDGNARIGSNIEFTAYNVDVVSRLPEGAYQKASAKGRAGGYDDSSEPSERRRSEREEMPF